MHRTHARMLARLRSHLHRIPPVCDPAWSAHVAAARSAIPRGGPRRGAGHSAWRLKPGAGRGAIGQGQSVPRCGSTHMPGTGASLIAALRRQRQTPSVPQCSSPHTRGHTHTTQHTHKPKNKQTNNNKNTTQKHTNTHTKTQHEIRFGIGEPTGPGAYCHGRADRRLCCLQRGRCVPCACLFSIAGTEGEWSRRARGFGGHGGRAPRGVVLGTRGRNIAGRGRL